MQKNVLGGFFILCFFACMALGVTTYLTEYELRAGFTDVFRVATMTTKVTLITTSGLIILAGLAGGAILTFIGLQLAGIAKHRKRLSAAQALQAERDAQLLVTVAPAGSQTYVTQLGTQVNNLPVYSTPLHLAPGRVNGEVQRANVIDLQKWLAFNQLQSINHAGKGPDVAETFDNLQPLPENVDLAPYMAAGATLHRLFLGVGRFADGRIDNVIAPLDGLIHIAAGGASGFGKSTFIQALCYQVLNAREKPDVVLLDPQAVTFTPFTGHERIMYQAHKPGDILAALTELVAEMERRQELFSKWRGIQNLGQYNAVVDPAERLSALPVFFDEFGLVGSDKDIARQSKLLSAGGRKAGIALIVSTQSWGHTELSTAFRANLSTAIQFKARDKSESRILLGDSAAADLQKPGEALARLPGQAALIELKAPNPAGLIDGAPELLPEVVDPLARLFDRLDGDDNEAQANQDTYFVQLVKDGMSRTEASRQAYGREYAGNLVSRCKRLLGEI